MESLIVGPASAGGTYECNVKVSNTEGLDSTSTYSYCCPPVHMFKSLIIITVFRKMSTVGAMRIKNIYSLTSLVHMKYVYRHFYI